MMSITETQLIKLMSKTIDYNSDVILSINKDIYDYKKSLLDKRLDYFISILKTNHWDILNKYFSTINSRTTACDFLLKVYKNEINDKSSGTIYSYLIEIYTILG